MSLICQLRMARSIQGDAGSRLVASRRLGGSTPLQRDSKSGPLSHIFPTTFRSFVIRSSMIGSSLKVSSFRFVESIAKRCLCAAVYVNEADPDKETRPTASLPLTITDKYWSFSSATRSENLTFNWRELADLQAEHLAASFAFFVTLCEREMRTPHSACKRVHFLATSTIQIYHFSRMGWCNIHDSASNLVFDMATWIIVNGLERGIRARKFAGDSVSR